MPLNFADTATIAFTVSASEITADLVNPTTPGFGGYVDVDLDPNGTFAGNAGVLATAIDAAIAADKTLVLPGGTIPMGAVTVALADGQRLRISGNQTTFTAETGTTSILGVAAAWPAPLTPSAVVLDEDHTFPDTTATRGATKLTIASHGLDIGDVVKVGNSAVVAANARFATHRTGQFAVVGDVSGDDIWLTGTLRTDDDWSGSFEVWKVPSTDLTIAGLAFGMQAGAHYAIELTGLTFPKLTDIRIDGIEDAGVFITGCYKPRVHGLEVRGTQMTPLTYPYGVTARHTEGGIFTALTGSHLRHLFTTTSGNSTPADGRTYGVTADCVVASSVATACVSGFDTHQDALGVHFIGCVSRDNISAGASAGAGFSLRGRRVTATSCHVDGANIGANIFSEADAGSITEDVTLVGFTCSNVDRYAAQISQPTSTTCRRIIIAGGDLRSRQHVVFVDRATDVHLDGPRLQVTTSFYSLITTGNGAQVRGRAPTLVATASGTTQGIVKAQAAADVIDLRNARVVNAGNADHYGRGAGIARLDQLETDGTPTTAQMEATLAEALLTIYNPAVGLPPSPPADGTTYTLQFDSDTGWAWVAV